MSHKNVGILNKFKSKSIDKIFNNTHSNTTTYQYIELFDNITENECIKLDNLNREIYRKNMELFDSINKKIQINNALFKITTPPQPPTEPNNHERYLSYKLRNASQNVKHQSYAVNYLLSKGYKMYMDKIDNKTDIDFEPFEAIKLFETLENISIDSAIQNNSLILTNHNSRTYNLMPSAPSIHELNSNQPTYSTQSMPTLYSLELIQSHNQTSNQINNQTSALSYSNHQLPPYSNNQTHYNFDHKFNNKINPTN